MAGTASAIFYGVEIPEALIATEIQNHPADSLKKSRQQAGRALAAKAVLLARANELGLTACQEKDEDGLEETPEEALIRQVLSEAVDPENPPETAIREIYDSQPHGFQTPPLMEASHILVAPGDQDNDLALSAHKKASELITLLQESPAKFFSMAKTISACPSATDGGALGQLGPGDVLPPIWEGLLKLDPGDIGAFPVRTEHGWHIIRLDHRIEGRKLPFEHVRGHIQTQLEMKAWTLAAAKYVDQLLKAAAADIPALRLTAQGTLSTNTLPDEEVRIVLGDVLSDPALALKAVDEQTALSLKRASEQKGMPPKALMSDAISHFLTSANDDGWTKIISLLRESESPLTDCLGFIAKQYLPQTKTSRTLIQNVG